jgi:hypothetical protein
VQRTTSEIEEFMAWAYGVPAALFEAIGQSIAKELMAIFRDAHELSTVLKRDILSVQMSVILASRREREFPFNPHDAESVWPEMGVKPRDKVLGNYSLGLVKRTKTGEMTFTTLPKVFTAALIRQVEKNEKACTK